MTRVRLHAVHNGEYIPLNSTADGKLQVDSNVNIDTSLLATEATQQAINTKIVSCDTSNLATEAGLTAINTKIVACDTSNLATEAGLTAINTKIVACDTTPLTNIETEITALSATVNINGEQKVSVSSENYGSHNNVANNISLAPGATTTPVSIAEIAIGQLFYQDSATGSGDSLDIEVSVDNVNWYKWGVLFPFPSGAVRTGNVLNGSAHGLKWLRLKNVSNTDTYTNVEATVCGSH